jgi:hypothetical protein
MRFLNRIFSKGWYYLLTGVKWIRANTIARLGCVALVSLLAFVSLFYWPRPSINLLGHRLSLPHGVHLILLLWAFAIIVLFPYASKLFRDVLFANCVQRWWNGVLFVGIGVAVYLVSDKKSDWWITISASLSAFVSLIYYFNIILAEVKAKYKVLFSVLGLVPLSGGVLMVIAAMNVGGPYTFIHWIVGAAVWQVGNEGLHMDLTAAVLVNVVLWSIVDFLLGETNILIKTKPDHDIDQVRYILILYVVDLPVFLSSLVMLCVFLRYDQSSIHSFASGTVAMEILLANGVLGTLLGDLPRRLPPGTGRLSPNLPWQDI